MNFRLCENCGAKSYSAAFCYRCEKESDSLFCQRSGCNWQGKKKDMIQVNKLLFCSQKCIALFAKLNELKIGEL